jgi:hypothetical protein
MEKGKPKAGHSWFVVWPSAWVVKSKAGWLLRRLAAKYARSQRLDAWLDVGENGTFEPTIPLDYITGCLA